MKKVRQDNGRAGAANRVQQRTFVYDNRGFLTEETHPEKGGPVRYGDYDPRGHAWTKEDGIVTRKLWFGFDPAERLTEVRKDNPGGQLLKRFTYDGSGRGLGKLATAARYNVAGAPFNTTAVVTETYTYQGVEGRVSQKTTRNTVGGTDYELFTQSQTYDRAGNVLNLTYPTCSNGGCGAGPVPSTPRVVSFGYTNGFLTDIPGYTGAHAAPSPAVGILYHSNGMMASALHANGVRDSVTVDAANWLRRPKRLETVGALSSRNFVAGDYAYDASGNIRAIGADLFRYDKVSRLTEGTVRLPSWVSTVPKTQGYSFDDFGNMTAVTGTNGRNTPTSDFTNRLTGGGTSYDEAGNLIAHNGTSYQFDRLNMLKRMTTAAGAAQEDWIYVYTADDERLWSYRVGGGGSLWSLRDLSGLVIRQFEAHTGWSNTKDMIHRQGQLFATVLPSGAIQHYHLDHLGTPRLVTDASKAAVANFTYFPFGEELAGGTVSAERMRFTGHERDLNNAGGAGDDLDMMHARFCSPVTGRFLSVDRGGSTLRSPQTWNRYTYATDNPLRYLDPDGRSPVLFWQWQAYVVRFFGSQDQHGGEPHYHAYDKGGRRFLGRVDMKGNPMKGNPHPIPSSLLKNMAKAGLVGTTVAVFDMAMSAVLGAEQPKGDPEQLKAVAKELYGTEDLAALLEEQLIAVEITVVLRAQEEEEKKKKEAQNAEKAINGLATSSCFFVQHCPP